MTDPRWGKQTELAITNFPIAGRPLDVRVARALAASSGAAASISLQLAMGRVYVRPARWSLDNSGGVGDCVAIPSLGEAP